MTSSNVWRSPAKRSPSRNEGRCQRASLAGNAAKIPASALPGGNGPCRGQSRKFSEQIDVVIFDRQYSPFIFNFQGQTIVPAESVYAVFEAKQVIDAEQVKYAQDKAESVRKLTRTSLPIPHLRRIPSLYRILAGLMTLESGWNPPLGQPLLNSLISEPESRLDLGCVAAHGVFGFDEAGSYSLRPKGKPATAFLLELIALLQNSGTVPMIDVRAYARWLAS